MKVKQISGFPAKKEENKLQYPTRKQMTDIGFNYGFNQALKFIGELDIAMAIDHCGSGPTDEDKCPDCGNEGGRAFELKGTIRPTDCGGCGREYPQELCDKYNQEI